LTPIYEESGGIVCGVDAEELEAAFDFPW